MIRTAGAGYRDPGMVPAAGRSDNRPTAYVLMLGRPPTNRERVIRRREADWAVETMESARLVACGLEAALKARAPGVYASTPMVRQLAVEVSRALGLDGEEQALVDLCSGVRDIGMVALPDRVVLATGALSPDAWGILNRHPALGADLLKPLAGLGPAAEIVRSHHERWDGEGYPDGRRREAIPVLSRVIAACDAFVAMASDRPHRRGTGVEAALERVEEERGRQFDPRVVDELLRAVAGRNHGSQNSHERNRGMPAPASAPPPRARGDGQDLRRALARWQVVPAFGPAVERLLAVIGRESSRIPHGDLVAAIESDTGLTIAILQAANRQGGRRPITNVFAAVTALSPDQIRETVTALPRAAFPWQTPLEALMHHLRVHACTVSRAAEWIAREVNLKRSDDLLTAALLHDVGKLVLADARRDLLSAIDARTATPEHRVLRERQTLGLDHASLGGLLLEQCGLPKALSAAVARHHSGEAAGELETFVRLADIVAHHAQSDAVDRGLMLRLAQTCGLPLKALRDALFDLPHSGGSNRRRAEPSPLSERETTVLRSLAEGKLYKEIARDLDLTPSTVRTHLHNIYGKLGVADRAQAVLRAAEMGWI